MMTITMMRFRSLRTFLFLTLLLATLTTTIIHELTWHTLQNALTYRPAPSKLVPYDAPDPMEVAHRLVGTPLLQTPLGTSVRIVCWVMTGPSTHKSKALHVWRTWGKRCNTLLFFSSEKDDELPTVQIHAVGESRRKLWYKAQGAFLHLFKFYLEEADWFLKADDDTFVVMENLRYFLKDHDPSAPQYFGYRFRPFAPQGYFAGGPGYVMSRESLIRLVNDALTKEDICPIHEVGPEDVQLAKCMTAINVTMGDTRDALGRPRFLPTHPAEMLFEVPSWLAQDYSYYRIGNREDCCSDIAISFHQVSPKEMYLLDYLIYHHRLMGSSGEGKGPINNKTTDDLLNIPPPSNQGVMTDSPTISQRPPQIMYT